MLGIIRLVTRCGDIEMAFNAEALKPERQENEGFKEHKSRQANVKKAIKMVRRGQMEDQKYWISRDLASGRTVTFVKKEHGL